MNYHIMKGEKMRCLYSGCIILSFLISCQVENTSLLIEAERFEQKGGWVVDPQFVEQVGSPYLLAHGLGVPVENARTQLTQFKSGHYHVWVRTMNWAPGEWDAPGRFKIVINSQEIETVLGTEPGWNWQYAGSINLEEKHVVIELKDVTGFDGRCDVIYFSTIKQPPPNQQDELRKWRKEQLHEGDAPVQVQDFDFVIIGGGIAGCAAAIAAAELGLDVALIHDRPVLGGNASSEIRVHTEGITWHYDRILKLLNTEHYPNGSPEALQEDKKRHANIEKYSNIVLFLNWRAYAANTINDSITSVDARHTSDGKTMRFTAPLFADCTGDGWIGYWSGAEYMYGREDSSSYNESWEKYGELWSPGEPDNRVMGASLLWRSFDTGKPVQFPNVPWAMNVAKTHIAISGEWYWEFSRNDLHQIDDAEKIRDHLLKAIYGSFFNAKQKPDFYSEALYYEIDHYFIPYRCLYSKNIRNLFMAGRCFSCSHIGLGGPRIMNTTGQMGAAVGYAATLCAKHKTIARNIYLKHLEELKKLIIESNTNTPFNLHFSK